MKKIKNIALILAAIYIVISIIYMTSSDEIVDEKITIEKVETVKEDTTPVSITPVKIKIARKDLPVIKNPVIKGDSIVEEIVYTRLDSLIVDAKEYHYIDSVKNGILESWITADNIYKRRIKLTTFNTKREITVVRSLWFLELGPSFSFDGKFKQFDVGINYVHKNKWSLGMKVGYDNMIKTPYVGLKIGIPLKKRNR